MELVEAKKCAICNTEEGDIMNIYLIGFMGVGKSTVAKELSKKLDYKLIDTDEEIEDREDSSISDIFESQGEEYFRGLERALIKELSSKDNMIVSCGGGIIKSDENIRLMRESGRVILLEASPETIYHRVKDNNTRPLLIANPGIEGIRRLLSERQEYYDKAYTDKVDSGRPVRMVVDDIARIVK